MRKYIVLPLRAVYMSVIMVFVGVFLFVALVHRVAATENGGDDSYANLRIFTDVMALVQKNYVEEVQLSNLVEGAIKGMLLSLDPHSSYLTKEMYSELQVETKGEFGGLGIEITVKDGLLTVVAPIEGSPASRAGVKPGDQIIKIGDEFAKDFTLLEAVRKMRGPKGSPLTIHVHRDGVKQLIPITVIRDIIEVQSVRSRVLEDGFVYLRLSQFQEGSASEVLSALSNLENKTKNKKITGLVLDLRNNPGGLLTQAVRVSDLFLDEGVVVYTQGRLESQNQKYFANKDGTEPTYPMVVIINEGSASASEIVAGALQDHRKALIVGTRSFGKGSVQTILPMGTGTALRLTTALYYTQSGRSIQAEGIVPDVVVTAHRYPSDTEELLEEDEDFTRREKDLRHSIKNPQKTPEKDEKADANEKVEKLSIGSRSAMEAELSELLKEDPQLDEALRLLKTWHVFQGKPTMHVRNWHKQARMKKVGA
ncbi:MAG: S41 family peptidase [Deltaproteobacteria bacterium]|nr:S41 family peptidase [Deltaproteobacteria bacterium]